ncbi:hypothetical protein OEZ86_012854 [Tetradesmus obliquus]|nr:hypothetical protein OEZ86_012854 [Tetradesmus obliquus]
MGALQPAAARISSKAAAQHNSTFNTCNTGTSRLRLANVEQLPAGCRPGHSGMGAAVLDCFRTSKVTVKDCRVNIKPKAKSKASKLPAVCKLLHAQGRLNGPSNATLLGVLSEAQLVKYAAEHPEELAGSNATKLQQQLLSNLALLFGRAVLRSKSNCTKAAAGSSSSTAPPRPVETAGGASGDSASSGVDCNDTHTADGDADADADVAAAAAAAAAVGKAPAKLYRQGSSLILQTHASCQFQFAVTKNAGRQGAGAPGLLCAADTGGAC